MAHAQAYDCSKLLAMITELQHAGVDAMWQLEPVATIRTLRVTLVIVNIILPPPSDKGYVEHIRAGLVGIARSRAMSSMEAQHGVSKCLHSWRQNRWSTVLTGVDRSQQMVKKGHKFSSVNHHHPRSVDLL
jgi:hypothetical protein